MGRGFEVDGSAWSRWRFGEDNCGIDVERVFRSRPPHLPPTSTSPTTFGAYGADKQLRSALGPARRGQHRQAPRGALAHEQSHFAVGPTLMQPEPASCHRAESTQQCTPGNGVLN